MKKNKIRIALGVGSFIFFTACQGSGSGPQAKAENPNPEHKLCKLNAGPESVDALTYKIYEMNAPEQDVPFEAQTGSNYNTPTTLVPESEWPTVADDLQLRDMELAIERQLERYKRKNLSGTIRFGNDVYSQKQAPKSLKRFLQLTKSYKSCLESNANSRCQTNFEKIVKKEFNLYRPLLSQEDPRYGEDKQTLFTAYYTPLLRGRNSKDNRFKYGVYNKPYSKNLAESSRREIDFQNALEGKGINVFYAEDLFELYLLHVQGGGRVINENKSGQTDSYYISYDGTNGQKWTFISKYMQSKGYIDDLSIMAQRDFLRQNPHKQEEIYATCPSYVYFKKTSNPPFGNDSVPLTDNRSIATDTNYYRFKGLLAFISARKPTVESGSCSGNDDKTVKYENFSRFFLDQDTGGAIRGKARVDMYFGEGPYAEHVAYNTVQRGDLYFLMLKK